MKERLGAIMNYKKKSKLIISFTFALAVIIFFCVAVISAYATQNIEVLDNQTVVYEHVEIRSNDGEKDFNYITNVRSNNTTKKIMSCDRSMLAFDKEGNPLELDWWTKDDALNYHYLWTHGGLTREILSGEKDEQTVGWRLNATLDPEVSKIAYILFCDKEITFEDGTVWENPNYEQWISTYEGKKIDVDILESYYPYIEEITF